VSLSNKDREIAQLPLQTETITAANSDITDEGLKLSGRLRYLRNLVVSNTAVTDHGLSEISNLPALEYLDLSSTKISDAGVQSLKNLKNLSIIDLRNTNVTEEGIRELHKALPSCTIYNDVCGDIRPDKIAMWEEPRDPYANANLERVVPYPSHLAGATSIEQFGNIMHEGWLSGKPEDMGKFTRDLIKLRSGMAQLIEEISPILNPEIAEVQSRWPDLSPEQAEAVAVLRLSANDPEFALKYELFSRLSQQYDSKMEPMRQSLQEALDRASASLGMPQVELNFIQGWGASGVYGDGKISVCSPYQLDDFPKLTALIYHEQVHAKQDVDIICLARDRELGDARLSTDQETRKEQLEKVASTYKEMTGHELNLDWATRVITYREQHSDSLQLTPLERERAESLTQPLRDYPETRQGTLEQDFRDVERTLKFRLDDAGVEGILQALANHETKTQLSLILFGSENPPPEIQAAVDYFSRHHENFDALSLVQTKTALRRLLIERLHRINQERRQNSEDYFFNPFEAEAQIVGRLAERIYQQRFSRPEDAKDVV
jgi:hypothetical protein